MILVDNAVELTAKTYLGLPKRVTGIALSRKRLAEVSESFPDLLDALEEHAEATKLAGIDLAEIDRWQVEVYSELANLLFDRLFGEPAAPVSAEEPETATLQDFLLAWADLDEVLRNLAPPPEGRFARAWTLRGYAAERLVVDGRISEDTANELLALRDLRNALVHPEPGQVTELKPDSIQPVRAIAREIAQDRPSSLVVTRPPCATNAHGDTTEPAQTAPASNFLLRTGSGRPIFDWAIACGYRPPIPAGPDTRLGQCSGMTREARKEVAVSG